MLLERIYDEDLAQAGYFIGCQAKGEAVVVDARRDIDFEYEGDMTPTMALDEKLRQANYPFSRMKGAANVLVTPGIHSASISTRLLGAVEAARVIGPLLIGLERSVQIAQVGARVPEIVTLAALAAYELDAEHRSWAGKAG